MNIRERAALTVALRHYPHSFAGKRAGDALEETGWNLTQMYAVVNQLIDDPQAEAEMPVEIHRLQRLRTERQRARGARELGWDLAG